MRAYAKGQRKWPLIIFHLYLSFIFISHDNVRSNTSVTRTVISFSHQPISCSEQQQLGAESPKRTSEHDFPARVTYL